jgi:hypothetical protein
VARRSSNKFSSNIIVHKRSHAGNKPSLNRLRLG